MSSDSTLNSTLLSDNVEQFLKCTLERENLLDVGAL